VGKTLSARLYANWDKVEACGPAAEPTDALLREVSKGKTTYYSSPVVASPNQIVHGISRSRQLLHYAAARSVQRIEEARTKRLERRLENLLNWRRNRRGLLLPEVRKAQRAADLQRCQIGVESGKVTDPTTLLVIDEADRLKDVGLEQVRSIFDDGDLGLILIGMPGIEKRLARYPQLYSRVGFVHEFRPLAAAEVRALLSRGWAPTGVRLPRQPWPEEAVAALIRMTGGNFRLLDRLLTQIERILDINSISEVTREVVEAARESLVIGEA
jgi:DNA transposition AAA+ family ATPase